MRPQVNIRHAFYIVHNKARGTFSDFKMIEMLTPQRRGDNTRPASSWEDYDIDALAGRIQELNNLIQGKALPVIDLVEWL